MSGHQFGIKLRFPVAEKARPYFKCLQICPDILFCARTLQAREHQRRHLAEWRMEFTVAVDKRQPGNSHALIRHRF